MSHATPPSYLKSAIKQIYRDDDDFILIGLTGRTGSGCSTVASILQHPKEDIKHSLFIGQNPVSSEARKERIILEFFKFDWHPFLLIQVRSIITTFLLEKSSDEAIDYLKEIITEGKREAVKTVLDEIRNTQEKHISASQFYSIDLPHGAERLKNILGENNFVRVYQKIGKNIRVSGSAFSEELVSGKFFSLAEKIQNAIEEIHKEQKSKSQRTFIVIDTLRNPLEALFFQDRYSSFYLLAVSTPEEDRQRRLRKLNYSEDEIKQLDETEYTSRDINDERFYSVQDIQGCLQRADIYVSNPDVVDEVSKYASLSNQLIRFVSLIRRPGIVTPTAIERCMQVAHTAKLNSGCISRQVGAAVTDQGFGVRAIGWNDVPRGQIPCNLRSRTELLAGTSNSAYSDFERSDNEYLGKFRTKSSAFRVILKHGRNDAYCFKSDYNEFKDEKNQVHTRSLHAEENAFLQLTMSGASISKGAKLFTTASPCELCSKKAYQLGIETIIYIDPYPGIAVDHVLGIGANRPTLELFSGAIGRAFHKLYTPVVAYKDELNAMVGYEIPKVTADKSGANISKN